MAANDALPNIPAVRFTKSNNEVLKDLGLLAELAGTWHGKGFNLIARPDGTGGAPFFLELNQTSETLRIDPIGSEIPNRGDGVPDIDLFGLTYLQKISDTVTGGALHIEPGIWITVPDPKLPAGQQNVVRMASIPHGNALLAQGTAIQVTPANGTFPITPVNTAPFPQGSPMPVGGTASGFPEFILTVPDSAANPRTPFGNTPPIPLPATIDGVPMQTVINDPTRLLQEAIKGLNILEMVVIEIATVANPTGTKPVTDGGGGIENIPFLITNADAAVVFATFWIEKIAHPAHHFMQLQYVQTVLLNFPILKPPAPPAPFSWPHVSVATLRKTFGGQ
ncbi:MAG: heme-binding protein [Candidatus Sulfotelmatobacter sp.]